MCVLHEHVFMGENVVLGSVKDESKRVCACMCVSEGVGEWLAKLVVL